MDTTWVEATLALLYDRCRRFDIREHEADLDPTVVRSVRVLLAETLTVCSHALSANCELRAEPLPDVRFALAIDFVLDRPAPDQLQRLAVLTRNELTRRLNLMRFEANDLERSLEWCSGAMVQVDKAITAMHLALTRSAGKAPTGSFQTEEQIALETRRQYCRFWRLASVPMRNDVEGALRRQGELFAQLRRHKIYARLRHPDRCQLRAFDQRRQAGGGTAIDQAVLWADFQALANSLRDINMRKELIAHDVFALRSLAVGEVIDIDAVEGLDDRLDRALIENGPWVTGLARDLLRQRGWKDD